MKIYLQDKTGRIQRRNVSKKNLKKYQLALNDYKYKLYNTYNKPKKKHKSKFGSHKIKVYILKKKEQLKIEEVIIPNLDAIKEEILNKFMNFAKDNSKIQRKLFEALKNAPINVEDDGSYQLNNIQTTNIKKAKFKLRADKDLRQFKLIIDDKYNYDLK